MKVTNQIIQQITSKVQIERVYQFSYIFLNQEYNHLLIALDSKCCLSPATLVPTIDMCLDQVQGLTYMLINSGELKTAIKNGNLFYIIICQEQNLCYHDGKKPIANLTKKELELIRVNKESLFYSSQAKAKDFMEGVAFYTKKGNLHQAAFMLHQTTEQFLRGFSDAVFNKDKPGHSLQKHLELISRFLPAIETLFPKGNQHGGLELLDKAYTSVRYKNNFVIEEEQLVALTSKMDLLLAWSNTFFNECLSKLEALNVREEQLQNSIKPVSTTDVPTEPVCKGINASEKLNVLNKSQRNKLEGLLDKICKQHPVSQVLALGINTSTHQNNSIYNNEQFEEHSAHCYLLVILKGSQEVRSYTSNQGDLKVTMLIHHEKEITYALSRHNRFFIHALQKNAEIYKSVVHPIQFIVPKPDWKHSLKSSNHFFESRLERLANMFLESANYIYQEMDYLTEASLLLLTHCIEQVCISYIYINTGYRVNNHHLPFLFDMCALIDADILNALQQNTDVGKRQKEALINCVQHIRNKSKYSLSQEDLSVLLKRCENLVGVVKSNCQTELDRLRNLAYPEKKESKLTV